MKKLNIINKKRKKLNKKPISINSILELINADYSEGVHEYIFKNKFFKEFGHAIIRYSDNSYNTQIETNDHSKVDLTEKSIITYLMWWYFYSQCDFRANITDKGIWVIPIDKVHLGFKKLNSYLPFARIEIKKLFEIKDIYPVCKYRKFNVSCN